MNGPSTQVYNNGSTIYRPQSPIPDGEIRIWVEYETSHCPFNAREVPLRAVSTQIAALYDSRGPRDNAVLLDDVHPDAFVEILDLLHKGHLGNNVPRKILMKAWMIADRFFNNHYKNIIMDALRVRSRNEPTYLTDLSSLVPDHCREYHALYKYIVHQIAYDCFNTDGYDVDSFDAAIRGAELYKLPTEMMLDLLAAVFNAGRVLVDKRDPERKLELDPDHAERLIDPCDKDGCHYHEHTEGEQCLSRDSESMDIW